ncbi:MAG: peptide chain release factor N(5)-glutamine methyltransferase [Alphaproteobacteria bacterium]|nr:peptide chain release factor N(5)-glutamine methyltransferase [Alphaproteobacteria bacterium]
MLTVRDIRKNAILRLEGIGDDSARLDVDLLLAAALGIGVLDIILEPGRRVPDPGAALFQALLLRRMAREPVAQILGKKAFWNHEFTVSRACLTPRPDSEILIESALKVITDRQKTLKILDLGTGSGCLLLSLMAELPNSHGVGVDISDPALAVARANAERLGFEQRCDFIISDWAEQLPLSAKFDIILANPPYIALTEKPSLAPEVRNYEPALALFADDGGLREYRRLAKIIPGIIAGGGHAFLEIGWQQGAQVMDIFTKAIAPNINNIKNIRIIPDLAGRDRCVAINFG